MKKSVLLLSLLLTASLTVSCGNGGTYAAENENVIETDDMVEIQTSEVGETPAVDDSIVEQECSVTEPQVEPSTIPGSAYENAQIEILFDDIREQTEPNN